MCSLVHEEALAVSLRQPVWELPKWGQAGPIRPSQEVHIYKVHFLKLGLIPTQLSEKPAESSGRAGSQHEKSHTYPPPPSPGEPSLGRIGVCLLEAEPPWQEIPHGHHCF